MLLSLIPQVVLPSDLLLAIQALVASFAMFVVTEGVKDALKYLHIDLSGLAAGVTAVLVGIIMAVIVGLLAQIPAQWSPLALELIRLAVLLLGGLGFYRIHKAKVAAAK